MAKLTYKTRGMTNPQGKPRVYFCCHPQDFERYFETISDELLERQNCAIWYDSEPEHAGDEEYLDDLKQMQLFVMPVTARLLREPNRAMAQEFPLAVENHIPILPLMQEGGLEKLFNQMCGNLQFLDRHQKDLTAISYEEKLETFLASVLVGDELAEKIRHAFDAYVFLSYRKKDRGYAQKLMRLIHRNDFCRDIAIWYDEFLKPGEDFNDAILEALRKSSLFVLTVTPNLVTEMNYIQTTEYPLARQENKPILPVEMSPTDRQALAQRYTDIPPCADGYDGEAFSELLSQTMAGIAKRENDGSLEHRFFIGLAYLSGIDVEVDHERAVALITEAAMGGLEEAMGKLVTMYRNAEGVTRDYHLAIAWQEKLVEAVKTAYEATGEEKDALRYVEALCNLGDHVYDIRDVERARTVYQQAIQLCEEASGHWESVEVSTKLSICYDNLGGISQGEELLKDALEYYEKSLHLREQIAEREPTVKHRKNLAVSYYRLGEWYRRENQLGRARDYFTKEYALIEQLSKEDSATDWRRDLLIGYCTLGDVEVAEHQYAEGLAYYEKCLAIARERKEESATQESLQDLSITYEKLGFANQWAGDLDTAKTYYLKSLDISQQLLARDDTFENRRSILVGYYNLGEVYNRKGELQEAKRYCNKMLELTEQLSKATGTIEARKYFLAGYSLMGSICQKESGWLAAMKYYKKAEKLAKQLAIETKDEEALAMIEEQ